MIVEAGKTLVEMVLTLVLYLGLFRVSEWMMKQKILFTNDERTMFKETVTSSLVSMVSLLYLLYMHDAEGLKRIHSWHLCLCIITGGKQPLPQMCVFFMIVVTHMASTYDSLHALTYMAFDCIFQSVGICMEYVPLKNKPLLSKALWFVNVSFQMMLMSYSCWVRTLQWTTFIYMLYIPYMGVSMLKTKHE